MTSATHARGSWRLQGMLLWGLILPSAAPPDSTALKFRLDNSVERLQIVLVRTSPAVFTYRIEGREILLQSAGALEIQGLDQLTARAPEWIENVSSGYDSLLLRAARDVVFSVKSADKELVINLAPSAHRNESPDPELKRAEVRLDLLEARLNGDTGRISEAAKRLHALAAKHPDDPDVLTSLANIEAQAGRWRRASALYSKVLLLSPENQDVREAGNRLMGEQGSQVSTNYLRKTVAAGWQENMIRISGQALLRNSLRAGVVYDRNYVQANTVRRANGTVGSYEGIRNRAELTLQHNAESGAQLAASLFLDGRRRGAGVALNYPDLRGQSRLVVDYQRPYWEFVEGLIGGGYRDRIEIYREQKLTSRLSGWVSGAVNRYGLGNERNAARSLGTSGGLNYLIVKAPAVILQYGFDGEYRRTIRTQSDSSSVAYSPIPLVSREVHAMDIAVGGNIHRAAKLNGFAGYAVDRLGGTGPYVGARFAAAFSKRIEAQVDFERRLSSVNTGRAVNLLTCRVIWKMRS